jgi:hypothetical protein
MGVRSQTLFHRLKEEKKSIALQLNNCPTLASQDDLVADIRGKKVEGCFKHS